MGRYHDLGVDFVNDFDGGFERFPLLLIGLGPFFHPPSSFCFFGRGRGGKGGEEVDDEDAAGLFVVADIEQGFVNEGWVGGFGEEEERFL